VAGVRFVCRLVAFAGILGLLSGVMLHFRVAAYPYLESAFAGSFAIYMWTRPSAGSVAASVLCGAFFAAAYARVLGGSVFGGAPAFLGLGSLASLSGEALWGRVRRQASLDTCLTASMFPIFLVIAGISLAITGALYPRTYDWYLYAFDEQLGMQPSFLIGRLLSRWSLLRGICYAGYEGLPLAMAIAFAMERSGPNGRMPSGMPSIMRAFMVAAGGGFLLYNLYPAAGPVHVFGTRFPGSPPPAGPPPFRLIAIGDAPRNAMPSVHIAMALLIWWNARGGPRWWRWLAGSLLLATFLATLGFGEHYLADVVVAVPFALLAQALAANLSWRGGRLAAAATGALLVALWLTYLRFSTPPWHGNHALAWGSLLATTAAALWQKSRLDADRLRNAPSQNRTPQPFSQVAA
jgi:PAP2 superfamily